MSTATISHTKNHLSALLVRVQQGESILILDRDRPVARLVPVEESTDASDDHLQRLEVQGLIRRPERSVSTWTLPTPVMPVGSGDVLAALLADRDEGR